MSNYGALEKFLRVGEGRRLKQLAKQADYVTSLEPDFEALSDEELVGKTAEFKERLENGEELDELVFEAFAAVREAAKRLEAVRKAVGEDIEIYDHLARTKRSSAYRQNILSERECKIAHYHETMAKMISS